MFRPFPAVSADPGVTRRVLAETPEMMVVSLAFGKGAVGRPHSHPHAQSTYVRSGRFAFLIDGTEHLIGPGDSLVIPGGRIHGCRCLEASELIDTFAPRRDDFL
jgi:quercetin dioxygenase-like cupin family protein